MNIDLELLKRQKMVLLEIIENTRTQKHKNTLDGILNLLDAIHDDIEPVENITADQAKAVLKNNGIIQHFWNVADITHQADIMGVSLTDEQIQNVVSLLENVDANTGISFDSINCFIDMVVSKPVKTQISHLRSGTQNQILNCDIDYSIFPKASSHVGHSGSNKSEVQSVWEKIISENPNSLTIRVKGLHLILTANKSRSGKTVTYFAEISKEDLTKKFFISAAKKETPSLSVQDANTIMVTNGKNSYVHLCPSLIEII